MNHSPQPVQLMWFRDDLRTADNPALTSALSAGPVIAVFILDEDSPGIRPLGGAAKWWLHQGLKSLQASLEELGIPLVLLKGSADEKITDLAKQTKAGAVHWNRRYGQPEREVDTQAKTALRDLGLEAHSYPGTLLHEPWELMTKNETGYKVFTPFYNALRDSTIRPPLPAPAAQDHVTESAIPSGLELEELELLPGTTDWTAGLAERWEPGEAPARQRLEEVLESIAEDYPVHQDRPDLDGTSALSPALRWGHLGAHEMWDALGRLAAENPKAAEGATAMRRQLAWRDFCWHLYYHHPHLPERNLRAEFDHFDWAWPEDDPQTAGHVAAWQRGKTGFRLVDAGMQQLWQTGWMHNRVRMVAASLLVKNLQVHWKVGERWFWDTLVDADIACNTANWQWVAGSGADAAPYFRVFNPELQAKKFDPQGSYASRFAPLAAEPIVDLKQSRLDALDAYEQMKLRRDAS
ncbi:cryptochrome/photolyase family protein [Arthrobacter sp. NIO-1057]|uniref:cryptochrome/photolyase family protein n=1 Tax=Arthrobacter sp. NIO-1057 TaxID=993071 RepID=UPI00071DADD1|nr:deoxyribodipyrimidine photo-lyase [Arthrobacter sp. NIO-1057]KSU65958.1 deoxyribodipyrimidine photolyase [Arthrobacter sp. NIO-1057]SCC28499.1 deoxyribodipyrimidine photo-lyase [Arthrobacter sp. NIO-1057]